MQGVDLYQSESPSRLPAPYTASQPVPVVRTTEFPTIHTGEDQVVMVPPAPDESETIHVPPMYTKPRPIIPRYRIISGLISFFVVIGLLCGGSIYYAQATGHLGFLQQLVNPQFQNLQPTAVGTLPVPTQSAKYALASPVITSATTASSIDANSQPKIPTNKFTVGKPIYVTYSIHAKTGGAVTSKWYTNGTFFYASPQVPIPIVKNGSVSDSIEVIYYRAAEGKVELYWNGKLQVTLYFVVEPENTSG
jgi:hypothetical protein